ncbi:hypothetical protein NG43_00330, partial [Winslowiella iniecta]
MRNRTLADLDRVVA